MYNTALFYLGCKEWQVSKLPYYPCSTHAKPISRNFFTFLINFKWFSIYEIKFCFWCMCQHIPSTAAFRSKFKADNLKESYQNSKWNLYFTEVIVIIKLQLILQEYKQFFILLFKFITPYINEEKFLTVLKNLNI